MLTNRTTRSRGHMNWLLPLLVLLVSYVFEMKIHGKKRVEELIKLTSIF
jgi:hypothetical protein